MGDAWQHYDCLKRIAGRILRRIGLSDDLAHDFALDAIMNVQQGRPEGDIPAALLITAVRWDILQYKRKASVRYEFLSSQTESVATAMKNFQSPPEQEAHVILSTVNERLLKIYDKYGRYIMMAAAGYTREEISDILGVPSHDVAWRIAYGRRLMRQDGYWDDAPTRREPVGVRRKWNKWSVECVINGEYKYLGMFDTASAAADAYHQATSNHVPRRGRPKLRRRAAVDDGTDGELCVAA